MHGKTKEWTVLSVQSKNTSGNPLHMHRVPKLLPHQLLYLPIQKAPMPSLASSRCFIECKYGCRTPGFGNYLWLPATSPQESTYSLTVVF